MRNYRQVFTQPRGQRKVHFCDRCSQRGFQERKMEQRTYRIYFLPGQTPRVIGQVQAEHLSANLVGASAGLSIDGNAYLTGWLAIHPSWRLRLERLLRLGPAPEMVVVRSLLTFSDPFSSLPEEQAFLQSLQEAGRIVCWDQAERPSFSLVAFFPRASPVFGSLARLSVSQ